MKTLAIAQLPRGAGGLLQDMGYIGMCRCEGYGFQALWDRVYKSESLDLE